MSAFPRDPFDDYSDDVHRVGAHRAPVRRGRAWMRFAWAALATGVLIVVGLFVASRVLENDLGIPLLAQTQAEAEIENLPDPVEPMTDPSLLDPARNISITVLDGSIHVGIELTAAEQLRAAGWPIGGASVSDTEDETLTKVYYSDPANEDVARGLVATLGFGEVRLVSAEAFAGSPITIVLGSDYPVPVEEAPVEEAPFEEAPVEEAPFGEAPFEEAPEGEIDQGGVVEGDTGF